MKKILFFLFFCMVPLILTAEEPFSAELLQKKNPTIGAKKQKSKFKEYNFHSWAIHSNILGFLQFGPVVSLEYSITRSLALSAHARFSSVGALTPILHMADVDEGGRPDSFSGMAFGGGPMWFFDTSKDKAYIGLLYEYEFSDVLYLEDYYNEWSQDNRKMIVMLNAGYRFRFAEKLIAGPYRQFDRFIRENLFLNAGIYAGAERNQFAWRYTEAEDGTPDHEGKEVKPFGMIEISVGVEF
jgi:hypothetical protein